MRMCLFSIAVWVAGSLGTVAAGPNIGHGADSPGNSRGVLAVMLAYSDRAFDRNLTNAHYRDMLFGSGVTSLQTYYAKVSGGKLTVRAGGVLGPYVFPDASDTAENESLIDCRPEVEDANKKKVCPNSKRSDAYQLQSAIDAAVAAGHDFKQYDANNDGKVTDAELGVFAISAEPSGGGGYRCVAPRVTNAGTACDPYCKTAGTGDRKVSICLHYGMNVSSHATTATFVHELGHHLGAADVYGAWLPWGSGMNFRASVMAGTGISAPDWRMQFDPYHRMRFGWMPTPIVVSADGPSKCLELAPAGNNGAAVVVHDPKRPKEYFLVEYRRPTGTDPNVGDEGVAVWHVRHDDAGRLAMDNQVIWRDPPGSDESVPTANIPSARWIRGDDTSVMGWGFVERIEWGTNGWLDTTAAASDTVSKTHALHLIGPHAVNGRWVAGPRGAVAMWRREHGTARLAFPGAIATPAGVQLDVGEMRATGMNVRFTTRAGALPAGTSSACSADTAPVVVPPPASMSLQPSCLTRRMAFPNAQLTTNVVIDFHQPLVADVQMIFWANAFVRASSQVAAKGTRTFPFQVTTRSNHSSNTLDVMVGLRWPATPGVPARVQTLEHSIPILPDRGHFTCNGVPKRVALPPIRMPVHPIADGRMDIPVFHLHTVTREQLLENRLPRLQTDRLFKNKLMLRDQLDVQRLQIQRKP